MPVPSWQPRGLFLWVPTDKLWAADFLGPVQGQGMCWVSLGPEEGLGCQVPEIQACCPRLLVPTSINNGQHPVLATSPPHAIPQPEG